MESAEAGTPTKQCPFCGETILAVARKCQHCRKYLDPSARPVSAPVATGVFDLSLAPSEMPGLAIASLYLGLFSLLPCVGIPAMIVGWLAIRKLKREPQLSGRGRAYFALVMGVATTLLYGGPLIAAIIVEITKH